MIDEREDGNWVCLADEDGLFQEVGPQKQVEHTSEQEEHESEASLR